MISGLFANRSRKQIKVRFFPSWFRTNFGKKKNKIYRPYKGVSIQFNRSNIANFDRNCTY
jgi:hypothetical protein